MPLTKKLFSKDDVDIISRETVYKGFFRMEKIRLRHRVFDGGWSRTFERELMLRGEAVGVIPYDPENKLIGLIEQFRVGAIDGDNPWLFELVAGIRDDGEMPEQAVRREALEESGVVIGQLCKVCECWISPGGMDEKIHLFIGLADLSDAGGNFGQDSENEDIRFHVLPEEEAFDLMNQGLCNNSATLIGLLWLQQNRLKIDEMS